MKTMNAVCMERFGSSEVFSLQKVAKPVPQAGQILIRIKASGFNPVDWKIRQGWYGGESPKIIGMDCSGIVEAVGAGVENFKIGDEVYAMTFFKSSGGSYAEYVCVPQELAWKKPNNITFEQAASIPLAAMTAYRAVVASSACKKGDRVFVAGIAGGVGSFVQQFLKWIGVGKIFTVARDETSAKFIHEKLSIPQDQIVLYGALSNDEIKAELVRRNGGRLFDATVDLVGGKIKKLCLELTGYSGHFVTILPENNFDFPFWGENDIPRARNLSVHQVAIGAELASSDRRDWQIYSRHLETISLLLEKGEIKLPHIQVVGRFSVQKVSQAHSLLEAGHVKGKLVMVVE